ncbi:hypothetical protein I547_2671 [Mycobacterium kansasii 824]|nr:hypothetical protein I547_2671 [Mycobacterium kansasii 824]
MLYDSAVFRLPNSRYPTTDRLHHACRPGATICRYIQQLGS